MGLTSPTGAGEWVGHFRGTPLDLVHLFVQSPCGHILREGVGVKSSKDSPPSAISVVLRIGSEYGDDAALCKANGPAGSHVLPSAHSTLGTEERSPQLGNGLPRRQQRARPDTQRRFVQGWADAGPQWGLPSLLAHPACPGAQEASLSPKSPETWPHMFDRDTCMTCS